MNATAFYDRVRMAMETPPIERHQQLLQLHTAALQTYQTALQHLTTEDVRPAHDCRDHWTYCRLGSFRGARSGRYSGRHSLSAHGH